jgi:hypothetical protein
MRGSGSFCVCHRPPGMWPNRAQFDSVLLSVLSKPSRTVSPEHTQTPNQINILCVCRKRQLDSGVGGAKHHTEMTVPPAHGIQYVPSRLFDFTSAR